MLGTLRRLAATLIATTMHRAPVAVPQPPVPMLNRDANGMPLRRTFERAPARKPRKIKPKWPTVYWHPKYGLTWERQLGGCHAPVSRKFVKRLAPNHPLLTRLAA